MRRLADRTTTATGRRAVAERHDVMAKTEREKGLEEDGSV